MPIRTIKPEFWTDEKVVKLSHTARLLFLGLLNQVDNFGLMEWSPLRVKFQVFPGDNIDEKDIEGHSKELEGLGLVRFYGENGNKYLAINNFLKHQRTNTNVVPRCPFPEPGWASLVPGCPSRANDCPSKDSSGKEGKGRERKDIPGQGQGQGGKSPKIDPEELALAQTCFIRFWDEYPRKQKRKRAWEKFWKQKCHEKMKQIMRALAQQKQTEQWRKEEGRFVPLAATWIYNEQWEDEVAVAVAEAGSSRETFRGLAEEED